MAALQFFCDKAPCPSGAPAQTSMFSLEGLKALKVVLLNPCGSTEYTPMTLTYFSATPLSLKSLVTPDASRLNPRCTTGTNIWPLAASRGAPVDLHTQMAHHCHPVVAAN